jgi:hypothetical protein
MDDSPSPLRARSKAATIALARILASVPSVADVRQAGAVGGMMAQMGV